VVEIYVSDSGPGIPEDVLPRIFTPFYTTRQKGTGLGLAFVKEIVADHGGSIQVNTGHRGTTFSMALPMAADKESWQTS
jgi:two-component system C4-dicarboxylate transport sensor histidine kinase DctB